MSDDKKSQFWGDLREGLEKEGLSGGTFCAFRVFPGYPAYVVGFGGDEREKTFFEYDPRKKKDHERARAKATAFWRANGGTGDNGPDRCVCVRFFQSTAMYGGGKPASWNSDLFESFPLWQTNSDEPSATKDQLKIFEEYKIQHGKQYYGRTARVDDPNAVYKGVKKDTDQKTGEPAFKKRRLVVEIYPNEAAWKKAIAEGESKDAAATSNDDLPPWTIGWTAEQLDDALESFKTKYGPGKEYETFAGLVDGETGEDVSWGIKLLSDIDGMKVKQIAAFANMTKGDVREALA